MKTIWISSVMLILVLSLLSSLALADVIPSNSPPLSGTNTNLFINYTVNDASLTKIIFNWNGTNVTLYSNRTTDNINDGLILHYSFNNISDFKENNSYVVDTSPDMWKNATAKGNTSYMRGWGLFGSGAFNFSGDNISNNYVTVQGANVIQNETMNYTVSLWFKATSIINHATDTCHTIWSGVCGQFCGRICFQNGSSASGDNFFVAYYNLSEGESNTEHSFYTGDTNHNLKRNAWNNIVYTFSTNVGAVVSLNRHNVTAYSNGVFSETQSFYGTIKYYSATSRMGADDGYPYLNYLALNGSIDEIMVWNRTMLPNEIKAFYGMVLNRNNMTSWSVMANKSNLSVGSYTYYVCTQNSSGFTNCTDQLTYDVLPVSVNVSVNYSNSKGVIHNNFYGSVCASDT